MLVAGTPEISHQRYNAIASALSAYSGDRLEKLTYRRLDQ